MREIKQYYFEVACKATRSRVERKGTNNGTKSRLEAKRGDRCADDSCIGWKRGLVVAGLVDKNEDCRKERGSLF